MTKSKFDLAEAFKEHGDLIYKYVYARTGFSKEASEDLTQQVFLKAWNNRNNYDPARSSVKNWLFMITKNLLIDYYRSKEDISINREIEITADAEELKDVENKILVKKILQSLDETEREIVILRYFDLLSIKEIAHLIGKNYIATKVYIHRIIKKIKESFNEK